MIARKPRSNRTFKKHTKLLSAYARLRPSSWHGDISWRQQSGAR